MRHFSAINSIKYKLLLLLFLLSFIPIVPLLRPGFPPTHDGEYHVIRFYEFDKVLRSGNWYPRWAPDLDFGFGVPLFNYVYPLPNYVASLLHLFNIGFIDGFKYNMIIASILGTFFFFLWAKTIWDELGALLGSVIYTYAPYHFLDIYVRGSVGEVWALALYPALLWSITHLIVCKKNRYVYYSAVFLSLIIFSHNILALLFFPFFISYALLLFIIHRGNRITAQKIFLSIALGLGLSAIFWMPALLEKNFVSGLDVFDYKRNFADFYDLLIPSWGTGFSDTDLANQMSIQIGIVNLLSVLAGFFAFLNRKSSKKEKILMLFSLAWFFLLFFLMLKGSKPIWNMVPLMNYFQFPWRLLSLIILVSAFLSGGICTILPSHKTGLKKIVTGFIIIFTIIITYSYTQPAYYHMRNDLYYVSRSNFIDGTNSPGNAFRTIWLNHQNKREKKKLVIANGDIMQMYVKPTEYSFYVNAEKNESAFLNTAYFPGWTAYVDKKKVPVFEQNGLLSLKVLKGRHQILVRLENTFVGNLAVLFTLLSFFGILILSVYPKFRE